MSSPWRRSIAARVLGVQMFDEQIAGALGLVDGKIIEMQTGEGKTLAAVPAIAWLARDQTGVHVLTANDYLARRDADWMRRIYERMGLSVAAIDQSMDAGARRAAYDGEHHLRDGQRSRFRLSPGRPRDGSGRSRPSSVLGGGGR